jgi:predicted nucleic acid-binding Zn ribbon protein
VNCRFCGTVLPEGAQFCGECGRSVAPTASTAVRRRPEMPAIVFSSEPDPEPSPEAAPRSVAIAESENRCPQCAAPIADDDVFCGECGFVLTPSPLSGPVAEPEPAIDPEPGEPTPPKILRPVPDPFPWGQTPRLPSVDLEATRAVASPHTQERFVLQFSTGESVTVTGGGLVGRNPASQPGEFIDQLVTIFDAGKSVSKTHLEFGQDGGRFWVSDRYSTNGSTVRQPDAEPKRCEPGRRYFVARGTRVDIGDQFFVIS